MLEVSPEVQYLIVVVGLCLFPRILVGLRLFPRILSLLDTTLPGLVLRASLRDLTEPTLHTHPDDTIEPHSP